jgi:DNA processing protein
VYVTLDTGTLRLAVTATRYGRGHRRLASQLRQSGPEAVQAIYLRLTPDQQEDIENDVQALAAAGVDGTVLGEDSYPRALTSARQAPPVLFHRGNRELLTRPAIGICGSRDATDQGLRAARACGQEIARCGLVVVSGYARGVDTAAHAAALEAGGQTVLVLPEGIGRFKVRRWLATSSHDPRQLAVVSQFAPAQTWKAGAAMSRNDVIIGLSLGLVVIEAGDTGGTLAAGTSALAERRPVLALDFGPGTPPGNTILLNRGAVPVRSLSELTKLLHQLLSGEHPGQLALL